MLFAWDPVAVQAFASTANQHLLDAQQAAGPPPEWLTTVFVTEESVMDDMVAHLASTPANRSGNVLLAPNDMIQFSHLAFKMGRMEMHPFVQACMAGVPAGRVVATTYSLGDGRSHHAVPADHPPPPAPHLQVFK